MAIGLLERTPDSRSVVSPYRRRIIPPHTLRICAIRTKNTFWLAAHSAYFVRGSGYLAWIIFCRF
ncbi:hypothetical protein Mal64_20790 [Pseudobythopirellula maris]|uniref:Uncharacterized protein n=1 Tax=Pseudobythopirellula maris TaxID=2527991 RepID=A0A5C5ZNF2_9BACT|nr:hypothetical protein Mal64_20790 [Pseudobythopirellula maris]